MRKFLRRCTPLYYYLAVAGIASILNIVASALTSRIVPPDFPAKDDLASFIGLFFGVFCCAGSLTVPWRGRTSSLPLARRGPILLVGMFTCHLIALGIVFWEHLHHIQIFPSWADLFYGLEYPLILLVLFSFPIHRLSKAASMRLLLDSAMIMTALGAFSWYFLLGPILVQDQRMIFARIVGAFYPLADLTVLFCFLVLAARSRAIYLQTVKGLLLLALILLILGDSLNAYRLWQDSSLSEDLLNTLWAIAYVAFGISAYFMRFVAPHVSVAVREHPKSMAVKTDELEEPSLWLWFFPYALVPAVMLLELIAWQSKKPELLQRGVLFGGLLFFVEILARQVFAQRETRGYARQLHEANSSLETLATTDPITGLPNHHTVMEQIEEELLHAQQFQQRCAILFVDIDHFKRVNDTWGHQAGDALLRAIGVRIATNLRVEDFVGRYGGEEFAIVLTYVEQQEAYTLAERLRQAITAQEYVWQAEGSETRELLVVTASIGLAMYPKDGTTQSSLIKAADAAMYQAKHNGRNRVCLAGEAATNRQEPDVSAADAAALVTENATIAALSAAASAHDKGTEAHSQRIVAFAEITAMLLGCSQKEIYQIRIAALLHDIGKLGIPDAILHKPGPLTAEEWTIMRRHPRISQRMLSQLGEQFEVIAQIVGAHHERWDGKGYPLQLQKEEIPLGARILAVVDSYDAMTTLRVYHEPMPEEEARAELRRCMGSQYDPQVVEAFLKGLAASTLYSDRSSTQEHKALVTP